jgi:hypothetical protein
MRSLSNLSFDHLLVTKELVSKHMIKSQLRIHQGWQTNREIKYRSSEKTPVRVFVDTWDHCVGQKERKAFSYLSFLLRTRKKHQRSNRFELFMLTFAET